MSYIGFIKTYVDVVIKSYVGVIKSYVGDTKSYHVKVIWSHSVHVSENWAVTQKPLIVERNRRKFRPRGCSMHVGIFDLEHVKAIWGHSVHVSENWAVTHQLTNS